MMITDSGLMVIIISGIRNSSSTKDRCGAFYDPYHQRWHTHLVLRKDAPLRRKVHLQNWAGDRDSRSRRTAPSL